MSIGTRSLVVHIDKCTLSVVSPTLEQTEQEWVVYVEVTCGEDKYRTPHAKPLKKLVKRPSRMSILKKSGENTKRNPTLTLQLEWKGWFAAFPVWSRSMEARFTLHARPKEGSEHTARTRVPLSNVKTFKVSQMCSLVGEKCDARLNIAFAALAPDDIPPLPSGYSSAVSESGSDDTGSDSDTGSLEEISSASEDDGKPMVVCPGLSARDPETKRTIKTIIRHIKSEHSVKGWRTLLQGPLVLEGNRHVTFSRKQLKQMLQSLGVKISNREWAVLMRLFDPSKRDRILFRTIKSFMNTVEKSTAEPEKAKRTGTNSGMISDASSSSFVSSSESESSDGQVDGTERFKVGEEVEAKFLKGKKWVPGTIEKVRKGGNVFTIEYHNGSFENAVPRKNIRRRTATRKKNKPGPGDLAKVAGFNSEESEDNVSGSENDEQDAADDYDSDIEIDLEDLSDDVLNALAIIRKGVRRAQRAALSKGAIFSFPTLLEDHADIPTRPYCMRISSFKKALRSARIPIEESELDSLLLYLNPRGDSTGSMNWKRLLKLLEMGDGSSTSEPWLTNVTTVLNQLRQAMRRAGSKGLKPIDAFEMFDSRSSGFVSHREFEQACSLLGCSLSSEQIKTIDKRIRGIAPNTPAGRIDYNELLKLLLRNGKQFRNRSKATSMASDIQGAIQRMRDQLNEMAEVYGEAISITQPFEALDKTGEGFVNFLQFTTGIQQLGLVIPVEDIQAVGSKCRFRDSSGGEDGNFSYIPANRDKIDYRKFEKLMCVDSTLAHALRPQLRRAAARGISAWAAFRTLDRRETGVVSRVDFRKTCLSTLGLRMKEYEIRRLMDKFSVRSNTNQGGASKGRFRVRYPEFLEFVDPKGETGNVADDLSGLESKLRHSIRSAMLKQNDDFDTVFNLKTAFALFDTKGKSHCTHEDFFNGIRRLGLQLDRQEKSVLLARFDPRADGNVDYGSFVKFVGFSELEMEELSGRLVQRLRQVTAEGVDYRISFQVFDIGKTGFISRREFREAVRNLGLPITEAELHAMMRRFCQFDNENLIQYEDFLRFVLAGQNRAQARSLADTMQEQDRLRRKKLGGKRRAPRAEQRLTVNGNGYDGLCLNDPTGCRMLTKSSKMLFEGDESPALAALGDNELDVNAWLENGATEEDRSEFLKLERSIQDFKETLGKKNKAALDAQHEPGMFFDHSTKTVNRIVDHGKLARREKKAYQPNFTHPLGNECSTPVASYVSRTGLYEVPGDWQTQWHQATSIPCDDSAMRAVILDTFSKHKHRGKDKKAKKSSKKKNKKRGHRKEKRKKKRKGNSKARRSSSERDSESSSSSEDEANWNDASSSSSSSSDSDSSSSARSPRRRGHSRSKKESKSNKDSDSYSSEDSHYHRKKNKRRSKSRYSSSSDGSDFDPIANDRAFRNKSKKK